MDLMNLTESQLNIWWREHGRILHDQALDHSTRLFGAQFGHLWHLLNNPKGLGYSEREFGKMFNRKHQSVHICLKRLETFGYIKIEVAKYRRKLYIPLEKLTGVKIETVQTPQGRDMTQDTNRPSSPDYTLYLKPPQPSLESTTYKNNYAELPQWKEIESTVSATLRACELGQAYLPSFKTHFQHHPIPLQYVCNIIKTFAKAVKTNKVRSKDAYLSGSFIISVETYNREILQQHEQLSLKMENVAKKTENEIGSANRYNTDLAYRLNVGKKVVDSDFPKDQLKCLVNSLKVIVGTDGFVKRLPNVVFYTINYQAPLRSATIYDIDAMQRQSNILIPGLEILLEAVK